jgi:17beta-estradiol 17-dehydrogenase / very-long-chain 3-oxoacyl-CoA reductase
MTLIKFIVDLLGWMYLHFLASNNLSVYGGQNRGGWALITGASDGIGLGIAKECAVRGMHVLISARNEEGLKEAVAIIKAVNTNIQVDYIVADSALVPQAVESIKKSCADKFVTMLVNNVGVESGDPEPFEEKTSSNLDKIIDINIRFGSHLTKELLPTLLSNCKSKNMKCAIVNLSSVASVLQVPLLSSYSGSKAFNQVFSNALAKELRVRSRGRIDVLCARPTLVNDRHDLLQFIYRYALFAFYDDE